MEPRHALSQRQAREQIADWTYALTDEDRALARRLATRRDGGKPNAAHEGRVSEEESWQRHYDGLRGEIAAARLLGGEIDRSARAGGDSGYDLEFYGFTIEVKYRGQRGRDFALSGQGVGEFVADAGVLAWTKEEGVIRLVGWTDPTHLVHKGERTEFGDYGLRLCIRPADMRPMSGLAKTIKKAKPVPA